MTVLLKIDPTSWKDAIIALQCVIRDGQFGLACYSELVDVAIPLPQPDLEKHKEFASRQKTN